MEFLTVFARLASQLPYLLGFVLLYVVVVVAHRLYYSPIAHVPGPKLAAATSLYEFYHDCIHFGQFYFQIRRLHEQYGPIVRIGPNEVHIVDPQFFDKIYNVATKMDKDYWYYRLGNAHVSTFGTVNHDLHRLRRSSHAKHFSPTSIIKVDPLISNNVGFLCRRFEEHCQAKKVIDLSNAFRCLAADTVSEYVIPDPTTFLKHEDFAAAYNDIIRDFSMTSTINRHLGWVFPLIESMPRWAVKALSPPSNLLVYENFKRIQHQAQLVIDANGVQSTDKPYPSVLHSMYNSDLPAHEKTHLRLWKDAFTITAAGTETTGMTLTTTAYHLLSKPDCLARLQTELREHFHHTDEVISYRSLEKLPYLGACINEGLRLASGVSGRLPRSDPHNPIIYHPPSNSPQTNPSSPSSYVLPRGTTISMTLRDIHYDPAIFPDPTSFNPNRWLADPEQARRLKERFLVPFGKGSRGCVGSNLAMAELFAVLGNVFYRFGGGGDGGGGGGKRMELYETGFEDVEMKYDCFAPYIKLGRKGVRVVIK